MFEQTMKMGSELASEALRHRVLINSIPHCGTHLVATILELLGFKHSTRDNWQYRVPKINIDDLWNWRLYAFVKKLLPFQRFRSKSIALNWKTYYEIRNILPRFFQESVPISVGSPRLIRFSVIKSAVSKVAEGEYVLGHIPFSPLVNSFFSDHEWKGIVIIRDPRDMCLSMLRHISTRPQHVAYNYLFRQLDTNSARIRALVDGYDYSYSKRGIVSIVEMYASMLNWFKAPNFTMVRFEELVGPRGGGNLNSQYLAIRKILSHLDFIGADNTEYIEWIADNAFGKSGTFRKGQIGGWKKELNSNERQLFNNRLGPLIDQLEYEIDLG